MNGKQLKNSILQWAIQGKLVPQDPNDEPASVLLEKIRQEKERLIKDKKIKRDKNASIIYRGEDNSYYEKMIATGEVKCIDEEIPFEVPKGWEWCRFSSLYLSLTDGTHSTPKYTLAGIPFISVKDISSGIIDFSNTKYISKEEHQKLSDRCHPQKGDLLLSKVGTTGIPALVTTDQEFSLFVSVALIKLTQNKFSNEFLVFMIQSPLVQEQAKENTRGVGNKNWVLSAVSKTLMVVPPLEEQKRIKNRLNIVLPYIERYSSSQDKLDLLNVNIVTYLKKSILQEAIKGKLVSQCAEEGTAKELLEQIKAEKQKLVKEGKLKKSALNDSIIFRGDDNKYYEHIGKKCLDITDEIPFVIPETWQWVRIRDVFQLNPKNEAEDEKLVAFIPMEKISAGYKSDFTFDTARWGTIKKRFTHFANGDVAFAKITPCFQNRKSAIFHDLPNGIGAGTTELKVLRPYGNTIDRWYLLYFLESPYFIDEATFKGTANQQRIVVGYLENKLFPLPPRKQQQRIVEKIEQLMQLLK